MIIEESDDVDDQKDGNNSGLEVEKTSIDEEEGGDVEGEREVEEENSDAEYDTDIELEGKCLTFQDVDVKFQVQSYLKFDVNVLRSFHS